MEETHFYILAMYQVYSELFIHKSEPHNIHYMDDIWAAHKDRALLQQILTELLEALEN